MEAIRRISIVTALVPWLAVSAVIAPEHAHESDAADHVSVVHRHLASHGYDRAEVSHPGHDVADVSDADGHVVWLDQVGIAEATHSLPKLVVVVWTHLVLAPQPLTHAVVVADTATLPHGPPRVSLSLRAPPLVSRLI